MRTRWATAVLCLLTFSIGGVVGCEHGADVGSTAHAPQSAATVDLTKLDPGRYPTAPAGAPGEAGSEEAGRVAEGRRMADYLVGPWQADPEPDLLRNTVIRYATAESAAQIARDVTALALNPYVDLTSGLPVSSDPIQSTPIPGHPGVSGALSTQIRGSAKIRRLIVISAHGPYLLLQTVHSSSQDPGYPAGLVARILNLQQPLLDRFEPTDPSQFAGIPLGPAGLPLSRCMNSSGIVSHVWCTASNDRYAIRVTARQPAEAYQQMAAQYRLLLQ